MFGQKSSAGTSPYSGYGKAAATRLLGISSLERGQQGPWPWGPHAERFIFTGGPPLPPEQPVPARGQPSPHRSPHPTFCPRHQTRVPQPLTQQTGSGFFIPGPLPLSTGQARQRVRNGKRIQPLWLAALGL